MPGERPNLYVVARFLDALHEGPRTRSDLQSAAGVNYDILRRYLAFLETRGYAVARVDGTVALTVAGARVRSELRAWIERFLAPPDANVPRAASLEARGAPDAER